MGFVMGEKHLIIENFLKIIWKNCNRNPRKFSPNFEGNLRKNCGRKCCMSLINSRKTGKLFGK
jgi:hypothetical protein